MLATANFLTALAVVYLTIHGDSDVRRRCVAYATATGGVAIYLLF